MPAINSSPADTDDGGKLLNSGYAIAKDGKKFAERCNKYALFDNLAAGGEEIVAIVCVDLLMSPPMEFDLALGGDTSWPYTACAFSSDIARATYNDQCELAAEPMFARGLS